MRALIGSYFKCEKTVHVDFATWDQINIESLEMVVLLLLLRPSSDIKNRVNETVCTVCNGDLVDHLIDLKGKK